MNKGTSRKDCNLRQVLTVKYTKVIIISAKSFKLEEGCFLTVQRAEPRFPLASTYSCQSNSDSVSSGGVNLKVSFLGS